MKKAFLMKVSGKSHSAENPKDTSMLAKRFVSSKNGRVASIKTNWEKSHKKRRSFKKIQIPEKNLF